MLVYTIQIFIIANHNSKNKQQISMRLKARSTVCQPNNSKNIKIYTHKFGRRRKTIATARKGRGMEAEEISLF